MTKTALSPLGIGQIAYLLKKSRLMLCNDHLAYAVARVNGEWSAREVYQNDAYLAPIIRINGARSIEHSNAVFGSQSTAWTDLSLIAN